MLTTEWWECSWLIKKGKKNSDFIWSTEKNDKIIVQIGDTSVTSFAPALATTYFEKPSATYIWDM